MSKSNKMATCKHCGAEIASNAKNCPQCGGKNKKPLYKRPWFIIVVLLVVVSVIGSIGGNSNESTGSTTEVTSSENTNTKSESTAPDITYTPYNVSELMNDLNNNPLQASEKYKNQYVELTGRLGVIDSSGDYISIYSIEDEFDFTGVQCYIKSDDQKSAVMNMSIGNTLIVKGKIKDVGEVLGYSLDIDEIVNTTN